MGDVLAKDKCILILKDISGGYERHFISLFKETGSLTEIGDEMGWGQIHHFRYATPEEKERLLTAMQEAGKDFDFEKMEIVNYKWKPKDGERYFYPNFICDDMADTTLWDGALFDIGLFEMGIIVKTKEQATELAKKMLNSIK
jgi:hypothetical protein